MLFKKSTLLTSSLLFLLSAGIPSSPVAHASVPTAPKKPSADAKPAISPPAQPRLTPPTDLQLTPAPKPVLQKPTFESMSAGAEPRQVLRYKPVVNTKEVATMTLDMDMKMVFSGTTVPTKLPSTVMKMETIVTKVDSNGDIHYQFRYLDADIKGNAGLPSSAINAMRSQMKKLVGLNGTFVISDRGQLKSSNFQIPKTVDEGTRGMLEQMSQSLEQFSSALPTEAVGKGAKWRVVQPLQISGINMVQTSTYELVGVQDGVMTLKTTVAQTASSQVLKQPGLPANVTMQLKSMSSAGQGETVVRLDRLLPTKAALSISSQSEMEVKSARQATPMTVSTDSKIESTFEAQANK